MNNSIIINKKINPFKKIIKVTGDNLKCTITKRDSVLNKEIKKQILKTAATYKKQTTDKNFKAYKNSTLGIE